MPDTTTLGRNPFAPDSENAYATWSTEELETAAKAWHTEERSHPVGEELSRREDVDRAVSLWERLCAVSFVRGETQGYHTYSTAHLSPLLADQGGSVHRMPNAVEIEALVLSDGEETGYPAHDVGTGRAGQYTTQSENPWSYDERLYPITLTLITCGDYRGSDVDAANNRALQGTPGVMVREPNTGGPGSVFNVSTTVVGEMTSFINNQSTEEWEREPQAQRADALMWLESLVKTMESLACETTLIDEQTHAELIDELAEQAWSNHLENDTFDHLEDNAPSDSEEKRVESQRAYEESDALVHAAYFAFEGNEWTVSSLGEGAVNHRHADAVKHVARTVFGWSV